MKLTLDLTLREYNRLCNCYHKGCKRYIICKRRDDGDYHGVTKYGTIDLRNQVWYCKKHERDM